MSIEQSSSLFARAHNLKMGIIHRSQIELTQRVDDIICAKIFDQIAGFVMLACILQVEKIRSAKITYQLPRQAFREHKTKTPDASHGILEKNINHLLASYEFHQVN